MTSQLQFTLELENNKILDFLDLGTLRSDNELDFSIYLKPVHTDRHYNSTQSVSPDGS